MKRAADITIAESLELAGYLYPTNGWDGAAMR